MNRYFVKFVPYNERTITHLVNKTVKFSTVFEFNDLNEYRYLSTPYRAEQCDQDKQTKKLMAKIKKKSHVPSFNQNLLQLAMETRTPGCKNIIENFLESGGSLSRLLQKRNKQVLKLLRNLYQKYLPWPENELKYIRNELITLYEEATAYTSVGIFCMSNMSVFEDDAAQLMFAHYAKNSAGLALIYQYRKKPSQALPIDYANFPQLKGREPNRLVRWLDGEFYYSLWPGMDMGEFLYKSPWWGYEKEYRIFDKPGIYPTKKVGLRLKAILYTGRSRWEEGAQLLTKINEKFYKNLLVIRNIYTSDLSLKPRHFRIFHKETKNNEPVSEFLRRKIIKEPILNSKDIVIHPATQKECDNHFLETEIKSAHNNEPCELCLQLRENANSDQTFSYIATYNKGLIGYIFSHVIENRKKSEKILLVEEDSFFMFFDSYWESAGRLLLNTLEKNAKSTSNIKIVIHYSENNGAKLAFLKKNWFTVNSGHLIKEVIN